MVVLSARELGATMLANQFAFFPLDDQLTDERNPRRGPALARHPRSRTLLDARRGGGSGGGSAVGQFLRRRRAALAGGSPPPRPVRFEPLYVEDAWFLEVNPSEPTSEAQRPGRRVFKAGMRLVLSSSSVQEAAATELARRLRSEYERRQTASGGPSTSSDV